MKTVIFKTLNTAVAAIMIISLGGCAATQNANNKQKGAVIGAAGGAILGAVIGNNTGKKGSGGELGAIIGGVVGGTAGAVIGNEMDKQAQEIEEEVPGAKVERIDDGIVITFDDNSGVHFETNKYAISQEAKELLNRLGSILIEYPDTKVAVVGHTDSSGSAEYNMTLSKNRAIAVTNVLTQMGLTENRLTTKWYGENQPITDNTTPEGRAKNRRVNLAIVPNDKMIEEAKKEVGQN